MIKLLISIISIFLTPLYISNGIIRIFLGKEMVGRIGERFGISSIVRPQGKLIWIHAASVGEAASVSSLVDFLSKKKYRIVFTTYTTTSYKFVREKYGSNVIHQFFPYDNYFSVRAFMNKWRPDLAIFVESEFWPVHMYMISQKTKVISLNTRLSESTRKNWKRLELIVRDMLSGIKKFYPQSVSDQEFLKDFGFENVGFYGNLKYNTDNQKFSPAQLSQLKKEVSRRKIIFLFSSHPGEEKIFVDQLKNTISLKEILLVIAPRHPDRLTVIQQDLRSVKYAVRSKKQSIAPDSQVYIADTIGELPLFFAISDLVVVGGSLLPGIGGHNPIEPAYQKKSVLMGPHYENFREVVNDLSESKAISILSDVNDLGIIVKQMIENHSDVQESGKRAYKMVQEKSAGFDRLFKEIEGYIK